MESTGQQTQAQVTSTQVQQPPAEQRPNGVALDPFLFILVTLAVVFAIALYESIRAYAPRNAMLATFMSAVIIGLGLTPLFGGNWVLAVIYTVPAAGLALLIAEKLRLGESGKKKA